MTFCRLYETIGQYHVSFTPIHHLKKIHILCALEALVRIHDYVTQQCISNPRQADGFHNYLVNVFACTRVEVKRVQWKPSTRNMACPIDTNHILILLWWQLNNFIHLNLFTRLSVRSVSNNCFINGATYTHACFSYTSVLVSVQKTRTKTIMRYYDDMWITLGAYTHSCCSRVRPFL